MPKPEDSTLENTQEGTQENQEGQGQQQSNQEVQPQIDWENESNPYKKRYGDSQGQIQPLVRTLSQFAEYDHATKQWKPKTQEPKPVNNEDFNKILEGYDPEFRKALEGYTKKQISEAISQYKQETGFMAEYSSKLEQSRSQAITEFGGEFEFVKDGKFNSNSPLYKLADEILQAKYAQFNPDGSFHKFNTPEAEYLATVEAYAILAKRAKQPGPDKAKLNAINGKGTKSAGVKGKLSYSEYSKLSDEQKDAYDQGQAGL